MIFDKKKSIEELNKNAKAVEAINRFGIGRCAQYVRSAIDAGFNLENTLFYPKKSILCKKGVYPMSANQYGKNLLEIGFVFLMTKKLDMDYTRVTIEGYTPNICDIAVIINSISKHGHICMFNGIRWVSDFTQNDICGGPKYRTKDTIINIYIRND